MDSNLTQEILGYKWYKPEKRVSKKLITDLVQEHQERFKPFGIGKAMPCQFVRIWPGRKTDELMQLRKESKKSILQMFIGNALEVVREVALTAGKMSELDVSVRSIETKVKNVTRNAAIESAGLTVRSTITLPVIGANPSPADLNLESTTDLDVVEKAVDDAADRAGWHLSWVTVNDLLAKKNYQNPFTPLMEIYKMGLWPLGIVKNEYLVFVPGGLRTEII